MAHISQSYSGVLGEFHYDPKQFQLSLLIHEDGSSMSFLKYIGNETDAKNILIPEGLKDISYTFAHSNISGCPAIPESVEKYNHAFEGCSKAVQEGLEWCLENRNQVYPIVHYEGPLGIFDYNINEFRLEEGEFSNGQLTYTKRRRSYSDGGAENEEKAEHLQYIGQETDGSKIHIPEGIVNINAMFYETQITSLPEIPEGVVNTDGMCYRCRKLEKAVIKNATVIGDSAFKECEALKEVEINDGVTSINDRAFLYCHNLTSLELPESITKIGHEVFKYCTLLKSVNLPLRLKFIGNHLFYDCHSLEKINIPDSVISIGEEAFGKCYALKSLNLPDGILTIGKYAFYETESLGPIIYKKQNVKSLVSQYYKNENGFDNHCDIDGGRTYIQAPSIKFTENPFNLKNLLKTKEKLVEGFKAHKKTGGRIPQCIDRLAIMSEKYNIEPERIVENFDIAYTGNVLESDRSFMPSMVCRAFYPKDVCNKLYHYDRYDHNSAISIPNHSLLGYVASMLNVYNMTGNENYKRLTDFIATHIDSSPSLLKSAILYADKINIPDNVTEKELKKIVRTCTFKSEVDKINKKYNIDLYDCECSITPISTVYDSRVSRVLDFDNKDDIALGSRIGYLTNCCQHLGSAGETAMMHGFLNSDAGFFVIEDKDGDIKAQAEIWLSPDKKTLVFDNIEFANTDSRHYQERINTLRGDLAAFAEKSEYENIILGKGYVDWDVSKMEKCTDSANPELTLTDFERDVLKKARNSAEVYTDTGTAVYIKHDGKVSDFLMEGYDESKVGELTEDKSPDLEEDDSAWLSEEEIDELNGEFNEPLPFPN